jgi:hypothetical protein
MDEELIGKAAGEIALVDLFFKKRGGARPLSFYYRTGRLVGALPTGYGQSGIQALSEILAKRKIAGTGRNNLHKMARFSAVMTKAEVDSLEKQGVSWRTASRLTSGNLSASDRQRLIKTLVAGKVAAAKLGGKIEHDLRSTEAIATTKPVLAAHKRAVDAIGLLRTAKSLGNDLAAEKLRELLGFIDGR